jgi:hypothetical protein
VSAALASLAAPVAPPAQAPPPRIPATVVIRPAPRRDPPFDDELPATATPGRYDRRLPFELRPARPAVWQPRPPRSRELPDPGPWARRLLIGIIETASGRRPLHQLSALLSPSVGRGLGSELEHALRAGAPHWLHRGVVCSLRVCEPAAGVAEISAVVEVRGRVHAIALRLEGSRGRWRCTRLQLG